MYGFSLIDMDMYNFKRAKFIDGKFTFDSFVIFEGVLSNKLIIVDTFLIDLQQCIMYKDYLITRNGLSSHNEGHIKKHVTGEHKETWTCFKHNRDNLINPIVIVRPLSRGVWCLAVFVVDMQDRGSLSLLPWFDACMCVWHWFMVFYWSLKHLWFQIFWEEM